MASTDWWKQLEEGLKNPSKDTLSGLFLPLTQGLQTASPGTPNGLLRDALERLSAWAEACVSLRRHQQKAMPAHNRRPRILLI